MRQDGVRLDSSIGYLLKEVQSALRAAMDEALQPFGVSVSAYACLELLAQRPGLSNSELARGTFVTRQSMNVMLRSLERDGLVTRPADAPVGKVLPARLTERGAQLLGEASAAARSVELRMLADLDEEDRERAHEALKAMARSLRAEGGAARR